MATIKSLLYIFDSIVIQIYYTYRNTGQIWDRLVRPANRRSWCTSTHFDRAKPNRARRMNWRRRSDQSSRDTRPEALRWKRRPPTSTQLGLDSRLITVPSNFSHLLSLHH